jgi:hypothetical protein
MQEYGFFKGNLGCIPEDIKRMSDRKLENSCTQRRDGFHRASGERAVLVNGR